jgi:hypothetical protein
MSCARLALAGVIAACLSVGARAEIVKMTESGAQPLQGQGVESGVAYVRAVLDIEGALDASEPLPGASDKSTIGANRRASYKVQAVLLRPADSQGHGSTLLLDMQPEPPIADAPADLRQIALQRKMTILFVSPSFEKLAEPIRLVVLRDLVMHFRKSAKVSYVIGRGAEGAAELLQKVAALSGAEQAKSGRLFDGLLLHDLGSSAAAPTLSQNKSAQTNDPLVIETIDSSVFWRSDWKRADTGSDPRENGRRRRFFLAGMAARTAAPAPNCAAPINTRSMEPAARALLVALDEWVSKGLTPPASRMPHSVDHTLVSARDARWPKLPGLEALPKNDGLVPAVDVDGNETGGLRMPDQAVPLGTFTGWNVPKEKNGPSCDGVGAFSPFAKSKAERDKTSDPRLSMQERYGLRDFYVATVRTIADKLVRERLLLKHDADAYVAAAKKAPF